MRNNEKIDPKLKGMIAEFEPSKAFTDEVMTKIASTASVRRKRSLPSEKQVILLAVVVVLIISVFVSLDLGSATYEVSAPLYADKFELPGILSSPLMGFGALSLFLFIAFERWLFLSRN